MILTTLVGSRRSGLYTPILTVHEDLQLHDDEQSSIGGTSLPDRFNSYHYANLEDVEDVVESSNNANSEMVLISVDGHVLTAPISANEENMGILKLDNPQFHLGPGERPRDEFRSGGDMWEDGVFVDMEACTSKESRALENPIEIPNDINSVSFHGEHAQSIGNLELRKGLGHIAASIDKEDMFRSCLDLTLHVQDRDSQDSEAKVNSKNSPSFKYIVGGESSSRSDATVLSYSLNAENNVLENHSCDVFKQNEDQIGSVVSPCNFDSPSDWALRSVENAAVASEKNLATDNETQKNSIDDSVGTLGSGLQCVSVSNEIAVTEVDIIQTEDQGFQNSNSFLGM
ncbi:hypothetical protein KSP40_PGU017925 [Platanthera guangdongensis]|uniref:Uncharacterized protein n=1 Tax=Platanthera guangdongensis TaxID=2320717 RepID=A0ABR2LTF2_9ASPA